MVLAPADFEAYSQATGTPYPATAAERARLTPQVLAWKQQQDAAQRPSGERNALGPVLAATAGLLGVGAAGLGAYRYLRNRGADATAAADIAVDVDSAATAVQQIQKAQAGNSRLDQLNADAAKAIAADIEATRALQRQQPGGPRLVDRFYRQGKTTRQAPLLETITRKGGRRGGGEYRTQGKGAYHQEIAARIIPLADQPEAFGQALVAARSEMDPSEWTTFVEEMKAMASRSPENGLTPGQLLRGLDDMARYGAPNSRDLEAKGVELSRTKGNKSAASDYIPRGSKPQDRLALVRFAPSGRELEPDEADSSTGEMIRAAFIAEESPDGSNILNSRDLENAVRAANPQGWRESNQAYGLRIRGLIESLPDSRLPKAKAGSSELDPKRAEVFYEDSDGTLKPYVDVLQENPKTGITRTLRKLDKTLIAESDLREFSTKDTSWLQQGGEGHPFLTPDEVLANGEEADRVRDRYFEKQDRAIKGLQEPLPYSMIAKGLAFDEPPIDGPVGVRLWQDGQRSSEKTFLQEGWLQHESGGARHQVAGQALAQWELSYFPERFGRPPTPDETRAEALRLAQEHNSDPKSIARAALLSSAYDNTPGIEQLRQKIAAQAADARARSSVMTGWQGPAAAHRVGLPAKGDNLSQLVASLGMHAGADSGEMEAFVRQGRIREAAESLMNTVPGMAQTLGSLLPKTAKDEAVNIVAEGIVAGLSDLNKVIKRKPELASNFGVGKPGGFDVDAYLKKYTRDYALLRGLDISDNPTYQIPGDSFELIALKGREKFGDGVDPLKALALFTKSRGSAVQAVLDIDRLVSTARSTSDLDPNANGTRLAEALFDTANPDLADLNATTLLKGLRHKEVNANLGTKQEKFDPKDGFFPTKAGRNPSLEDLRGRIDAYGELAPGRPYSANSALTAIVNAMDSEAPGFHAAKAQIEAKQAYIYENQKEWEYRKALANSGIVMTPNGPQSHGSGLLIANNGELVFGGNSRNLSFREDLSDDDTDFTPVDQREESLQAELKSPEIALQDQELKALADADANRQDLGVESYPTNYGSVSKRTLDALRSDEVPLTEAERTVREYEMGKRKPALNFKNLGGTELAASPGEAAPALDALGRELAALTETRRYAAAQAGPREPFAVNFTGPEPGAPMAPWAPSRDTYSEPDGVDRSPEAIAARRQQQVQGRLDELADVEARMQQARANLALNHPNALKPGGVDTKEMQRLPYTETAAAPQSKSWTPQQLLQVSAPDGRTRFSVAGVDDVQLEQLTQRARQLRSLADRPEGNLFGQLEQTPRSAVAGTGNATAAANLEGFRAARAGSNPASGVPIGIRDHQLPDVLLLSTGPVRVRESGRAPSSPEMVAATHGEAFPDISDTRALSDFSTADARAAQVLAGQQRQLPAAAGVPGLSPQVEADMRTQHLTERLNLVFGTKEKPGVVGVATAGRLADDGSWVPGDSLRPKARGDNRLAPYSAPGPALLKRLAAIAGR